MSGQPRDDDAFDRPGQPDQPGNPGDQRDPGDDRSAGSAEGAADASEVDQVGDFEAFSRFAKSGDADERAPGGRTRRDSWLRKSGALLPGVWAKPESTRPGGATAGGATGADTAATADAEARPPAGAGGSDASAQRLVTSTDSSAGPASAAGVVGGATAVSEPCDKGQIRRRLFNWRRLLGRPLLSRLAASGSGVPAAPSPGASPDGASPDGASPDGASPDGASPDGTGQEGASPDGTGQEGAGQDGAARDSKSRGAGLPGWLRGNRLALAAGGLGLACTMLGGVIGGYIVLHTDNVATTNPSYSLGTVPPALNNRPASSVAGIAARVMPSVVMIKVNGGIGTGSGFIIRGDYIVTDNHVVTLDGEVSNAALRVYFSNGQSAPGQLVGRDPYSDIAIIKAVGVTRLPALALGNSTSVDVGDPVIAVGSPLGLADTVTSGIVSAVNRPVQPGETGTSPQVYFDAIQTDAPINPGNSGGPLVNGRGQVIGVDAAIDTLGANPLTGTQGGSIGLGFAIPINQARRVALQLIRTGYATHAVIGADIAAGWGGNGAEIMPAKAGGPSTVTPGGPAATAGLEPGDVITRFDGQTINDADTLLDAIRSLAPGTRTSMTFTQAGQTYTTTIQMGSAPS